jgi:hypothetical protein
MHGSARYQPSPVPKEAYARDGYFHEEFGPPIAGVESPVVSFEMRDVRSYSRSRHFSVFLIHGLFHHAYNRSWVSLERRSYAKHRRVQIQERFRSSSQDRRHKGVHRQYSPSSHEYLGSEMLRHLSQKSKMCGQTCARPAHAWANGVSETAVRMEPNGKCTPAQPAHSAQYVQTGQAALFDQQARTMRSLSKLRRGHTQKN